MNARKLEAAIRAGKRRRDAARAGGALGDRVGEDVDIKDPV
jgi:hypothetical protein